MTARFGWCSDRKHGNCRRAFVSPWSKTLQMCGCDTDGCPCAVMNYRVPEEVPEENPEQTDAETLVK